jgi:hypothetical protein
MAIVVGHGGGFGNAGSIIAAAIGREKDIAAQKQMQMRELQNRGAIASAQAQMQYEASHEANKTALAKAAISAGLQKDMQMSEYLQGLEEAKQKSKDDAAKYDQKFTTEQRVTDARLQQAKKSIESSPSLTPDQKKEALMRLDTEIATNANPTTVLGDPNAKPPKDGREPGEVYLDPNTGSLMSVEMDGNRRLHATYAEGKEGVQAKMSAERDREIDKFQIESEKARREVEFKRQESIQKTKSDFVSGMIKSNQAADPKMRMSPEQMKKAVEQFMDVMGEGQSKAAGDPNQELISAARKAGGSISITTPEGEQRSYSFKGESGQQRDIGNAQGNESIQWLENAKRQYGSLSAMPVEVRKQAQMHARRVQAMRQGQ